MHDTFYQVQYQVYKKPWDAFGEASPERHEANKLYLEFISNHEYYDVYDPDAVRIVSVNKCWDGVWRVREVLAYKDM